MPCKQQQSGENERFYVGLWGERVIEMLFRFVLHAERVLEVWWQYPYDRRPTRSGLLYSAAGRADALDGFGGERPSLVGTVHPGLSPVPPTPAQTKHFRYRGTRKCGVSLARLAFFMLADLLLLCLGCRLSAGQLLKLAVEALFRLAP